MRSLGLIRKGDKLATKEVKAGRKTSELGVTIAMALLAVLQGVGWLTGDDANTLKDYAVELAPYVAGIAYIISRTIVKAKS